MADLCNYCGESLIPYPDNNDCPHGLVNAKVTAGYFSYHLFDMNIYKFSICEKCLRRMFNEFKIKPKIYEYGFDADQNPKDIDSKNLEPGWSYDRDLKEYNRRVWLDTNGPKEKMKAGLCNFDQECQNKAEWYVFISDKFLGEIYCNEHKYIYDNTVNAECLKENEANIKMII